MKKTLVSIVAASLLALNFTGCGSSTKKSDDTTPPVDSGKEVKVAELGNVLGATVSVNGMSASEMASGYYKFATTPTSGKITSTGGTIDLNNNGVVDADDADAPNMSGMVNSTASEDVVTPFTTLVAESGMTASEVASILEINESDLSLDTSSITDATLKKKVILATAIVVSATDSNGRSLRVLPGVETTTEATTTEATVTPATTSTLPSVEEAAATTTEATTAETTATATTTEATTTTTTVAAKTIAELLAAVKSDKATNGLYKAVANVTGISEVADLETAEDVTSIHKSVLKKVPTTPTTEPSDNVLPTPPPTPVETGTVTTPTPIPTIPVPTPTPTPTEPEPTPTEPEPTPTPTEPEPTGECTTNPLTGEVTCTGATPTPEPTDCTTNPLTGAVTCAEGTPTPTAEQVCSTNPLTGAVTCTDGATPTPTAEATTGTNCTTNPLTGAEVCE